MYLGNVLQKYAGSSCLMKHFTGFSLNAFLYFFDFLHIRNFRVYCGILSWIAIKKEFEIC